MEIVIEKRATIAGGVISCRALGSHDRMRKFGVQEGTAEAIGVKVGRYPPVNLAGRMGLLERPPHGNESKHMLGT